MSDRTRTNRDESPAKLLYSMRDGARVISLGLTIFSEKVRAGEIFSVRIGKRRLVPFTALQDYTQGLIRKAREQRKAGRSDHVG